jgi:UDP-N-acetylmuramyl pentapeptide phosphotransferase/UDP-N-acetylglucosamine-1-phosphate transferase
MAQTKRKRRSKHRGTPAGTIEARGRTGRKPNAAEIKTQTREQQRQARMMQPPTWKGATIRASFAAALLLVFTQLGIGPEIPLGQSVAVAAFALLLYIPLGFYTDRFVHRRRLGRIASQKAAAAEAAKKKP